MNKSEMLIEQRRNARTANEHIAIIAAVPRGINMLKIKCLLALTMCWEAATTAICHHVRRQRGTAKRI
jgi:hypothetical protein